VVRILHITDAHCETRLVSRIVGGVDHDIAISSGDFECLDTLEEFLTHSSRPLATTGNLDNPSIYRRLEEAGALLDGRAVESMGMVVAGVGGLDVPGSMDSLGRALGVGVRVHVLVTHHPPHGVLDTPLGGVHAGLPELKSLVETLKPRLHLFGHIHESRGVEPRGATVFVNSGPAMHGYYSVIELGGEEPRVLLRRLA
jgi:Icc-related predicted phosphoesterase